MKNMHNAIKGFSASFLIVVVGVLALLIFLIPAIGKSIETNRLKGEIDRVAQSSGIQPSSVSCRNVELANICYAEYKISKKSATNMLKSSGYSIESSSSDILSGENQHSSVRIDSELSSPSNVFTIKFKDINVTL